MEQFEYIITFDKFRAMLHKINHTLKILSLLWWYFDFFLILNNVLDNPTSIIIGTSALIIIYFFKTIHMVFQIWNFSIIQNTMVSHKIIKKSWDNFM